MINASMTTDLTEDQIWQAVRDGVLPEAAALIAIQADADDGDRRRYRERIVRAPQGRQP